MAVDLINQERQATTLICRANYKAMNGLIGFLADECCADAACAAVCPTEALLRNPETGAIDMVRSRCIQCRTCVAACPFGNMLWDTAYHRVQKCDLCGGDPKCVPFCPTGALAWVPAEMAVVPPEPLDRSDLGRFEGVSSL